MKNNDFEYIKQGKIEKMVIQNTRDKGFRFVVTDKRVITELYDILSSAKEVNEKSTLEPDYIFEMQEGPNKVYKFNYIAGLDKTDAANLYSDNKMYLVSKRIDSDIIKSLWNLRVPKEFNYIYYESILRTLDEYQKKEGKQKNVGINIYDDVEVAKFILSTDLEDFKTKLEPKGRNAVIADKDKEYDVKMTVKTYGYKSTTFKAIITFWNKMEMSEKKYYVSDTYSNGEWIMDVFTTDTTDGKNKLKDF
jgi:MFS superfamily sulfate permease-like transporter